MTDKNLKQEYEFAKAARNATNDKLKPRLSQIERQIDDLNEQAQDIKDKITEASNAYEQAKRAYFKEALSGYKTIPDDPTQEEPIYEIYALTKRVGFTTNKYFHRATGKELLRYHIDNPELLVLVAETIEDQLEKFYANEINTLSKDPLGRFKSELKPIVMEVISKHKEGNA